MVTHLNQVVGPKVKGTNGVSLTAKAEQESGSLVIGTGGGLSAGRACVRPGS